jgi:hypothetical protein
LAWQGSIFNLTSTICLSVYKAMFRSFTRTITTSIARSTSRKMPTPQEIKLPGFGLPISYAGAHFPVVLGMEEGEGEGDWRASTLTIREVCMIKVIEDLTNKPEWWIKVNDDEITAKWKKEAMEMPWGEYRVYGDFTHAMADAVSDISKPNTNVSLNHDSVSRNCAKRQISTKRLASFLSWTTLLPPLNQTTWSLKTSEMLS